MNLSETAFKAAEKKIAAIVEAGYERHIDFEDDIFGALETLPPSMKDLDGVVSLSLHSTNIVDIEILANLTDLEALSLSGTKVSDVSVLKNCKKLQSLDLSFAPVSDFHA